MQLHGQAEQIFRRSDSANVIIGRIPTNPSPSRTASTIPAVKDEQLSELISRGTEINRVICGSLSMIISIQGEKDISTQ